MPEGMDKIIAKKPKFLIFGENHGTQESPAFVSDVVCALVARNERVLVAVEHDVGQDAAFQSAWQQDGEQFIKQLRAAGWAKREDGVASEAMFQLLTKLHALKSAGRSIDITAFNGTRDEAQRDRFKGLPGQGPHEASQAENIRLAASRQKYDRVIILVGSLHGTKAEVERNGVNFKPMAMQLATPDRIISLRMSAGKGTSWNCILKKGAHGDFSRGIPMDAIECGPHDYEGDVDLKRPKFASLWPVSGVEPMAGYDGIFWVGPAHASKPAVIIDAK